MKTHIAYFIVFCVFLSSSATIFSQVLESENDIINLDNKLFNLVNKAYTSLNDFKENTKELINQGADPNGVVEYRYTFKRFGARIPIIQAFYTEKYREALIITTPFHWVVSIENKEKTQILLDQGADINSRIDGKYPIDIAIKNNNPEMIDLLIKNGSKIEGVDIAELRDVKMIDYLIEKGADSTKVNFNLALSDYDLLKRYISYNPTFKDVRIDYRYIFDNDELFDFLIENGMPVSVEGTDIGKCKLIIGATQYQNEYALKKVIKKGGNVNEKCTNSFDVTPLTIAIKNENIAIVKLLLASGADPNQTTFMRKSSLSVAINTNNQALIDLIVETGVDINSAFIKSVKDDNEVLVSYFIEKGADVNYSGFMGNTPLLYAIGNENYDLVNQLISKGADVNYYNKYEGSSIPPLTKAVKTKDLKMVKLLVKKGANPHVDAGFNSPIRKAKTYNAPEIVAYLESLD